MSESTSFRAPFSVANDCVLKAQPKAATAERTLRVLFVGAYAPPAQGSRGVSEDLCTQLSAAGWRMQIVSQRSGRLARLTEMLWTAWRGRNSFDVAAVDVYSGLAFYWAEAVCWVLRRAGKPYVLMLHGGNLPEFSSRNPGRIQKLLCSAAAVTTPSGYLRERMQAYAPSIQLMPNAIHLEKYAFNAFRSTKPRLLWLRAFHEVYNPTMAVQVVALLKHEFPEIHLTMVGPDKGDGSLQRTKLEAERLGVADRLTILGPIRKEEVPNALADGDIFVNTARIDNTPVSVMEAMASGLTVVSTNVGGIPYLLASGDEALLVPSERADEMARAIRRIISELGLSERLARNARRKAEQLGWSNILLRWEELFHSVVASDYSPALKPVAANKNGGAA